MSQPFFADSDMSRKATGLFKTLAEEFGHGYGLGSMTCNVYDTAWLSCISKASGVGLRQWLFPSSFLFILDSQQLDGGWHWPPQGAPESTEGTVLCSLAALFAITQHIKHPFQLLRLQDKLVDHLKRGTEFVARVLRRMGSTFYYSVGFDVLAPALLELLEREGIIFYFSSRRELFQRRDARLSRVPIAQLNRMPSTMLHSLEALYGDTHISFDSLRSQLVHGSMMASPSATAAYLMGCNIWDDSAEAYLRLVISNGAGQGSGAAPSAFPSTHFELIWVASTLLKAGYVGSDLLAGDSGQILDIVERCIPENDLVGFAPGIQPDVDDSAKASIVLSLLGRPGLSRQMRQQFETETHFETYKSESNGSLSANCNTLLALLLDLNNDPGAVSAVEKVSKYLASHWFNAEGPVKDKWNVSEYYPNMLLAQAFMKMIRGWEAGELGSLSKGLVRNQIVLVAFRSMLRILHTQSSDGSWGSRGPREETAYAILALVELAGLPMASVFDQQIQSALLHGRNYLKASSKPGIPEYLWIEKVLYGAENLSQAYILAALNAPQSPTMEGNRMKSLLNIEYDKMAKFADMFQRIPLLASQPRWLILASWIEGQLFLPMLQDVRQVAFHRPGLTKDKYFAFIPVMWTLANNTNGCNTSARLLFDMMRVSVLNFQADEFMETVVDAGYGDDISTVRDIIEDLFKSISLASVGEQPEASRSTTEIDLPNGNNHDHKLLAVTVNGIHRTEEVQSVDAVSTFLKDAQTASDTEVLQTTPNGQDSASSGSGSFISQSLQSFVSYITDLASTAGVHHSFYSRIHAELKAFLLAHLTQIQLNRDFSTQIRAASTFDGPPIYQNPVQSFRTWLHATAAVHTSCPYSFALYMALMSAAHGPLPLLRTLTQSYVAEDLCGHLARMCRLYNDHGSLKRDIAEANLNSANFPEVREADANGDGNRDVESADSVLGDTVAGGERERFEADADQTEEERLKRRLMTLADWERKGLEKAMEELERSPQTDARLMCGLKVFVDVTDLFGQVYAVKDLASRKL